MNLTHYPYPSIEQFRHLVGQIRSAVRYVGKSEDGKPIFDDTIPLPTLVAKGTVKLHGTNASVVLDCDGNMYSQSRNNVLSLEFDNMGFNSFVMQNKDYFSNMLKPYLLDGVKAVVVYGEWCGANIQKGVAIAELPKMFVVFDLRVIYDEAVEGKGWWDGDELRKWCDPTIRVFNTSMFTNYTLDVDIGDPAGVQNTLVEFTNGVEAKCPVASYFGVDGVGEGIVWTINFPGNGKRYSMKVVGVQHTKSKVKKLAPVDTEKLKSVDDFIVYAFTENRFNQGLEVMRQQNLEPDSKNFKVFLEWVLRDVVKEEADTMMKNGINAKDINNKACNVIRKWYFQNIK